MSMSSMPVEIGGPHHRNIYSTTPPFSLTLDAYSQYAMQSSTGDVTATLMVMCPIERGACDEGYADKKNGILDSTKPDSSSNAVSSNRKHPWSRNRRSRERQKGATFKVGAIDDAPQDVFKARGGNQNEMDELSSGSDEDDHAIDVSDSVLRQRFAQLGLIVDEEELEDDSGKGTSEEEMKRAPLIRSTSLKCSRTTSSTPLTRKKLVRFAGPQRKNSILRSPLSCGQQLIRSQSNPSFDGGKKNVHFADTMGLKLESVKYFASSPKIRRHSAPLFFNSPGVRSSANYLHMASQRRNSMNNKSIKVHLIPSNFVQPSLQAGFDEKLRRQGVMLHSLTTSETTIYGLISVMNMSFEKKVVIRYTLNDWKSYVEQECAYVQGSHENNTDKFTFKIFAQPSDFIHSSSPSFHPRMFFAIRYEPGDSDPCWDNFDGKNYCLNCVEF